MTSHPSGFVSWEDPWVMIVFQNLKMLPLWDSEMPGISHEMVSLRVEDKHLWRFGRPGTQVLCPEEWTE